MKNYKLQRLSPLVDHLVNQFNPTLLIMSKKNLNLAQPTMDW